MPVSKAKKLFFDALIECPDAITNKGDDPGRSKERSQKEKTDKT